MKNIFLIILISISFIDHSLANEKNDQLLEKEPALKIKNYASDVNSGEQLLGLKSSINLKCLEDIKSVKIDKKFKYDEKELFNLTFTMCNNEKINVMSIFKNESFLLYDSSFKLHNVKNSYIELISENNEIKKLSIR